MSRHEKVERQKIYKIVRCIRSINENAVCMSCLILFKDRNSLAIEGYVVYRYAVL